MKLEPNCMSRLFQFLMPTLEGRAIRSAMVLLLVATGAARAVDTSDTRLLSQPALSAERIAFAYDNDLWIANLDGTGVRRLTSFLFTELGARVGEFRSRQSLSSLRIPVLSRVLGESRLSLRIGRFL